MKNKLKALMAGTLGVCAMAMVGVAKVNATDYTNYGSYVVSNSGATATWDFTVNGPSSNQYYKNGDSILGIVNTSSNQLTYKSESTTTLSAPKTSSGTNANLHIPVPSDSAGTITITGSGDNAERVLYLMDSTGTQTTRSIIFSKSGNSLTFTSDDITTLNENTYLRFDSIQSSGDYKIKSIVVTLTTGTYEATAETITVTIKDQAENVLKTDSLVVKGTAYTDTVKFWGKDFVGYYTDKDLSVPYDGVTTLTEDTVLYAKFTDWDSSKISSSYSLDSALISEIDGLTDLGSEIELTGTIYTLLSSVGYATSNSTPCISTGGSVSTTTKGIKIVVPTAGVISTLITSGGTSARNAQLLDSTGTKVTVTTGDSAWDSTAASAYEQRTLTYAVEAGTYYLGGDNGMRIFSVDFVENPSATFLAQYDTTTAADATKIRFVAVLDNISDVTTVDTVKFTFTYDGGERTLACTKLYSAVKSLGTTGDYAAKTNRYFAVFTLTDIESAIVAEKSLTNLKVTVTFTDGSDSVIAEHADIALGK